MDLATVMSQLESLGKEETAQAYKSQGAGSNVFGVAPAALKRLTKKIGMDHDLAVELWDSGNADARTLATMVADPDELTPTQATQWMKDVTFAPHEEGVAAVVAASSFGLSKMRQWRKQKSEYARTTGYAILNCLLEDDPDSIEEAECLRILKDIIVELPRSPNRARHAMVMSVIAIGSHKPELRDEALEAGEEIGEVEVDYGDSSGKAPRIVPSIKRAARRSTRNASVRSA